MENCTIRELKEIREHMPEPSRVGGQYIEVIRTPTMDRFWDMPTEKVLMQPVETVLFQKVLVRQVGVSFWIWKGPDGNLYP